MILLLAAVLVFGVKINGARAWFDLGFMRLQPSEFTKMATALMLGRYVSGMGVKLTDFGLPAEGTRPARASDRLDHATT